jgi:hypothetical protein
MLNDECLAGLWRRQLPYQLLWKASQPGNLIRSNDYRAPSWSWVSFDGSIIPATVEVSAIITIIEAKVDTFENGQVTGGYIRLQGQLFKLGPMQSHRIKWRRKVIDWDSKEPNQINDVYSLVIVQLEGQAFGASGLLLRAPCALKQGCFERVGMFQMETIDYEDEPVWSKNPELFCEGSPGTLLLV